ITKEEQTSVDRQTPIGRLANGRKMAPNYGGSKKFEVNPMSPDRVAHLRAAPRCEARTRSGAPCRCPGMPNGKCRIHGGLSPGAPRGAANGRYTDGYWTCEAVEERRFIRSLLKSTTGERS